MPRPSITLAVGYTIVALLQTGCPGTMGRKARSTSGPTIQIRHRKQTSSMSRRRFKGGETELDEPVKVRMRSLIKIPGNIIRINIRTKGLERLGRK